MYSRCSLRFLTRSGSANFRVLHAGHSQYWNAFALEKGLLGGGRGARAPSPAGLLADGRRSSGAVLSQPSPMVRTASKECGCGFAAGVAYLCFRCTWVELCRRPWTWDMVLGGIGQTAPRSLWCWLVDVDVRRPRQGRVVFARRVVSARRFVFARRARSYLL